MNRRKITSKNLREFSQSTIDQCNKISALVTNEFGDKSLKRCAGSYSFRLKVNGFKKTIVKLIPQREYGEDTILVGFSDEFENAECFAKRLNSFMESIDFGPSPEPFSASKTKATDDISLVASIINEFVKSNL